MYVDGYYNIKTPENFVIAIGEIHTDRVFTYTYLII